MVNTFKVLETFCNFILVSVVFGSRKINLKNVIFLLRLEKLRELLHKLILEIGHLLKLLWVWLVLGIEGLLIHITIIFIKYVKIKNIKNHYENFYNVIIIIEIILL